MQTVPSYFTCRCKVFNLVQLVKFVDKPKRDLYDADP